MTSADDIAAGSLWRCATTAGSCVARVIGVQKDLEGKSNVVLAIARRGTPSVSFERGGSRSVSVSGFLHRYRPVGVADAAEKVRTSRAKPAHSRGAATMAKKAKTSEDARQTVIASSAVAAVPAAPAWECDAVVIHPGVGGLTAGLREIGLRVVAVERDEELAELHRKNVGRCDVDTDGSWRPGGPARLFFYAQPSRLPEEAAEEAPEADAQPAGDGVPMIDDEKLNPRQVLLERAVETLVACRARAAVFELRGGRRGSLADREWLQDILVGAGYHSVASTVNPLFMGLPTARPTAFVVAMRGAPRGDLAFRWPAMTHAPPGNVVGIKPFTSVGQALGLAHPHGKVEGGALMDLRLHVPEFGASGPDGLVVEMRPEAIEDTGQPPAQLAAAVAAAPTKPFAVRMTPRQIATLLGVPEGFDLGAKRKQKRNAATSFPPMLARLMGRAAMAYIDEPAGPPTKHEAPSDSTAAASV